MSIKCNESGALSEAVSATGQGRWIAVEPKKMKI